MAKIKIDFGPEQIPITETRIRDMIQWSPRRKQLINEWPEALHEPKKDGQDWSLVLPFCETLKNAFDSMCSVNTIGLREGKERCYTFFIDSREKDIEKVRNWLSKVGAYVAIRDCLALSFTLDYDRVNGDPNRPQTRIGALRSRAKPYDGQARHDTFVAADEMIASCLKFIEDIDCYQDVDAIVAMPPSDPHKSFNLPFYLSAGIARDLGQPDLTGNIITCAPRKGLKEVPLENKLETLKGTIKVIDAKLFNGKVLLLIDDLYQSGISMNYAAMLMLQSGARKIYGLACEKTCSNDDNVKRKGK